MEKSFEMEGDKAMEGDEPQVEIDRTRVDKDAIDLAVIAKIEKEAADVNYTNEMFDLQKVNKKQQMIEDFQKKWAGALLLGPFVPAIISLIVIFSGQIVLNSRVGIRFLCEYPLDVFISVEIAVCYLFLVLYSWVFLGDDIYIKISYTDINWHILTPFRNLKSLIFCYIVLAVISTIVAIAGTLLLSLSKLCAATTPVFYRYAMFLVTLYWLIFVVVISNVLSIYCSKFKVLKKGGGFTSVNTPTLKEVEESMFLRKFRTYDPKKSGFISVEVTFNLCNDCL